MPQNPVAEFRPGDSRFGSDSRMTDWELSRKSANKGAVARRNPRRRSLSMWKYPMLSRDWRIWPADPPLGRQARKPEQPKREPPENRRRFWRTDAWDFLGTVRNRTSPVRSAATFGRCRLRAGLAAPRRSSGALMPWGRVKKPRPQNACHQVPAIRGKSGADRRPIAEPVVFSRLCTSLIPDRNQAARSGLRRKVCRK